MSKPTELYAKRRGGRGMYKSQALVQQKSGDKSLTTRRGRKLPEYLEQADVNALILAATGQHAAQARLLMALQWRAGLRVSEALHVRAADVALDGERPTIHIHQGKGGKDRVVPVHPELGAALRVVLQYAPSDGPLVGATRGTAWRWIKDAQARAVNNGGIQPGKKIGTHTLRHSAARHWLSSGVPINLVSLWLGHSSLQTTLIYLRLVPDSAGDMARVP